MPESADRASDREDGLNKTTGSVDIRNEVLRFAILAPSPHNTQPWKVSYTGDARMQVSIDRERLIPACDPYGRQAFISTGAFLENIDLAARSFGYHAEIELFPEGWPDMKYVTDAPAARIDLARDDRVTCDPLFEQIPLRHTSRRPYKKQEIPLPLIGDITASYDFSLVPLGFSRERVFIRTVVDLAVEAMSVELADSARCRETMQYFRFSDAEADRVHDGFGLAQSGYGRVARFLIGTFLLSREKALATPSTFCRMSVKSVRSQAESAAGIGWLSTKGDHRVDQVRAGRAFQRVHLKATSLGLSLHPLTQLLADYQEMKDLRADLCEYLALPDTHTVQMLFRLGFAPPVPATTRRSLSSFLSS